MSEFELFDEKNIPDATGLRIAIVAARFNSDITDRLTEGALDALKKANAAEVKLIRVPGCYELPLIVKKIAEGKEFDAIVALGTVIRGETPHFDYVAAEAAAGLSRAAYDSGIPVSFGVLTTENTAQALERAGGKHGNKGAEAAYTAIETVRALKQL